MIRQMCGGLKEEDQGDFSYQSFDHNINMQAYQDPFLLQPDQMQDQTSIFNAGGGGLVFPHRNEASQVLPWSLPSVHDPCLVPPPPQPSAGFFNRWAYPSQPLQFGFDGQASDHLRLLSGALGPAMQPYSNPFGLQAELGRLTAQEIMDAKALAASKSHSEAERRRRERINNHFAKLRSMLPNTPKTDKASLLAEVIQHVKELKRQTSVIAESSLVPTEADELTVDAAEEDGKLLIRAALCCEDRPDLLQELIKTLKALRLKTLKAEITTLGGRVKNVLFITAEENEEVDGEEEQHYSLSSIQGALKAVMEKKSGDHHDSSSGGVKRQRTANVNII